MSLYPINTLTGVSYSTVGGNSYANVDNSNPQPYTATGPDSDAQFRGANVAPTPMKGGYTYHRKGKRGKLRSAKKHHTKHQSQSISSVLGMDIHTRQKAGGKSFRKKHKHYGMSLGRSGGRNRKTRKHRRRRMRGGVSPFPDGYSLGGHLNPMLSALANPPIYQPYNN